MPDPRSALGRWRVAHLGARDYYSAPQFLHERGMLARFYTDFWVPPSISRLLPFSEAVAGRFHPDLPRHMVRAQNLGALYEHFRSAQSVHHHWTRVGAAFARWVAADMVRDGLAPGEGIIGYTAGSLELMQLAAARGVPGVHAQIDPGVSWYKTRSQELARWPGAEPDPGMPDDHYLARIRAEWRTASTIIVNSAHSASCLIEEGVAAEKIKVVPLSGGFARDESPIDPPKAGEPLKVLYAGTVSATKGFPYLAEAARLLGRDVVLEAAGSVRFGADFLARQSWPVRFHGHVARSRLSELMRASHVLVFPTLSDGFGLVQLEAMAHGLPVIATDRCGSVVEDGESGYVVEARSAEAIADRLARLIADPALLTRMSCGALARVGAFAPAAIAPLFIGALDEATAAPSNLAGAR